MSLFVAPTHKAEQTVGIDLAEMRYEAIGSEKFGSKQVSNEDEKQVECGDENKVDCNLEKDEAVGSAKFI